MPALDTNCAWMSPEPRPDLTDDAVLGGRLHLLQPRRGHRVGHDAILLAAVTAAGAGELAVDLGAGVGAAGLALACRCPDARVRLVEIDAALAALAGENAARNGLAERVAAHALDVLGPADAFAAAGLAEGCADRVLMNPPFNDSARQQASPDAGRRSAHSSSAQTLPGWVGTAERLLRDGGVLTLIQRADALDEVVAALASGFGGMAVLPVHPKPGAAAIRILVRATKARRSPITLLPGLVLNGANDSPTAEAEAVLRAGCELPLARLG
jgi:tRNA1(Val) A37 N6-methylase TrmN6